jgi:hypothetical protein
MTDKSNDAVNEANEVLEGAYAVIRGERRLRRIRSALRNLGVTGVSGPEWASLDEETGVVRFGEIPATRMAQFILHLEDLAEATRNLSIGVGRPVPTPQTGQLRWTGVGAESQQLVEPLDLSPVLLPETGGPHLGGAR